MIVTLNWLGDFVDLEGITLKTIIEKFTNIGFEVEEVRELSKGMERVRIGRIEKLTRHPNAERLQICDISLGGEERVQILTAATNVFEGALVPCALDGADLPNGTKINTTNMRGEVSMGMLCSGEELVITDSVYPTASVDGIMILDESATPGQGIAEFLGLDDVVLDLKVLANRPDCQSVMGLAKELSVALNREFKMGGVLSLGEAQTLPLEVEINTQLCPVYLANIIRDVNITQSNKIIQQRLRAIGLNPKNCAVDLTNYILFETGQPLHAFDYDKIADHKIIVRQANPNESMIGFDDKVYELNENMIVITDTKQVIGIAGVMGGRDFSVTENTKNLVIESAVFDRVSVRRTSRALGLRTDASARFERGVETISAVLGLQRTISLAKSLGIGSPCCETIASGEVDTSFRQIDLPIQEVYKTLGIEIEPEIMIDILNSLGIETTLDDNVLIARVPSLRADITRTADLIEEIIRFYGFDKIKPTYCEKSQSIKGGMDYALNLEYELIDYCLSVGANQVRTYGFRSPLELDKLSLSNDDPLRNTVKIENPLSLDYSIMRTQMLTSMLSVATHNEKHKNNSIKIFEIGKVFKNDRSEEKLIPTENKILAFLSTGNTDFFEVKSLAELIASRLNTNFTYTPITLPYFHPNISASISLGRTVIGYVAKVHPAVTKNFDIKSDCYYLELNLNLLPVKKFKKIKALPKFPAAYRDLSVVVDEKVLIGDMISNIKKAGGNNLENVELFDVYTGEQVEKGKKSVAFNFEFRKSDSTMTQEEVNILFDKILSTLQQNFDATLRA